MALAVRESLALHAVVATLQYAEAPAKRALSETQLLTRRAAAEWQTLPETTRQGWAEFASRSRRYSPLRRKVVSPTPRSLYIKDAVERWRLDPGLTAPITPPTRNFRGDDLGVFAIQSAKKTPVPAGRLRFTCTGANSSGVMTALLIQKLSGPHKRRTPRLLKAAAFAIFTDDALEIDLPVENGHYATGYRFIDVATLQLSPIMEAGTVSVGIKPRRKRASSRQPVSESSLVTPAVIDTNRFTTLQHFAR